MHLQVVQLDVLASDLKCSRQRKAKEELEMERESERREIEEVAVVEHAGPGAARLLFGDLGRAAAAAAAKAAHTDVHRNKAQIVVCNCALLIHINTSHTHTHRLRERERERESAWLTCCCVRRIPLHTLGRSLAVQIKSDIRATLNEY